MSEPITEKTAEQKRVEAIVRNVRDDFAARREARTGSTPAAWPSQRSSPRSSAQRPFPSIMMATCCGMRFNSLMVGHKYREKIC